MDKKLKWFLIGFLLTMTVLGMAMTIHGPVTNNMMTDLDIDSAQRGLLISLQGIGTLISAIIWSLFGDRTNKARLIAMGTIFIMLTSFALSFRFAYLDMIPILMLYGFGFAMIDIMSNAVVLDVYSKQKNILFYLHTSVGVGAIIGSIIASVVKHRLNWQSSYLVLSTLSLIALVIYSISAKKAKTLLPYSGTRNVKNEIILSKLGKNGVIWLILIGSSLFCMQEVGPLIWLPRYYESTLMLGSEAATLAIPVFYGGIVISRFVISKLVQFIRIKILLICGFLLASAAIFGLSFAQNIVEVLIFTILSGLFAGSSYPLAVMIGTEFYPEYSSLMSGIVFFGFSISTLLAPYLMGALEMLSSNGLKLSFLLLSLLSIGATACFLPLNPDKHKNKSSMSAIKNESGAVAAVVKTPVIE